MRTFDDFDAWGECIRGAHVRMVCDVVDTGRWALGHVDLAGVTLQLGVEGGGNACYGANAHLGPMLFVPLTHATDHIVNGERLDDDSLLAIPCGADFLIRVHRVAHAWCSIALPPDTMGPDRLGRPTARIATAAPGAVARLRRIATAISESLVDRPADSPAHHAAGRELTAAAVACLPPPPRPRASLGRPRLDRVTIVRRAMAVLDAATAVPTAADLARDVGVTNRTLLRTFQEAYGMPPKRYLLLRELHTVRRALRSGTVEGDSVADILTRHGIWEFGRFAGRYQRLFGELPSRTLRRARG